MTAKECLRQIRRARFWGAALVGIVGGAVLLLASCAGATIDFALASARPDELVVLASLMAGLGLTAIVLNAVARRILLRAALWTDHTLGQTLVDLRLTGRRKSGHTDHDERAIADICSALSNSAYHTVSMLPWAATAIVLAALISPLLAGSAALAIGIVAALAIWSMLRTRQDAITADKVADTTRTWQQSRQHIGHTDNHVILEKVAEAWTRQNHARVALDFRQGRRVANSALLARSTLILAGVGLFAAANTFVMTGELTAGEATTALVLLAWPALVVLGMLDAAPCLARAGSACRLMRAADRPARTAAKAALPVIIPEAEPGNAVAEPRPRKPAEDYFDPVTSAHAAYHAPAWQPDENTRAAA